LAFAYLGGISSVSGAVVGGLIVQGAISSMVITSVLHISDQYTLLLAGIGLITMAIFNPQGVAGGIRELFDNAKRKVSAPKQAATAEQTPEAVSS